MRTKLTILIFFSPHQNSYVDFFLFLFSPRNIKSLYYIPFTDLIRLVLNLQLKSTYHKKNLPGAIRRKGEKFLFRRRTFEYFLFFVLYAKAKKERQEQKVFFSCPESIKFNFHLITAKRNRQKISFYFVYYQVKEKWMKKKVFFIYYNCVVK